MISPRNSESHSQADEADVEPPAEEGAEGANGAAAPPLAMADTPHQLISARLNPCKDIWIIWIPAKKNVSFAGVMQKAHFLSFSKLNFYINIKKFSRLSPQVGRRRSAHAW